MTDAWFGESTDPRGWKAPLTVRVSGAMVGSEDYLVGQVLTALKVIPHGDPSPLLPCFFSNIYSGLAKYQAPRSVWAMPRRSHAWAELTVNFACRIKVIRLASVKGTSGILFQMGRWSVRASSGLRPKWWRVGVPPSSHEGPSQPQIPASTGRTNPDMH